MSLIIPIMVNSNTIGSIVVTRLEQLEKGKKEYPYTWEYNMGGPPHGGNPIVKAGHVTHNYYEPVSVLIQKVLEGINA